MHALRTAVGPRATAPGERVLCPVGMVHIPSCTRLSQPRGRAPGTAGAVARDPEPQTHSNTGDQGTLPTLPVLCGVIANRIANPDERQATRPDDPTRGGRKPYPCAFFFLRDEIICIRARDSHKTPHDASLSLRPRRPRPFAEPRRPSTPPHKSLSLQGCASLQR